MILLSSAMQPNSHVPCPVAALFETKVGFEIWAVPSQLQKSLTLCFVCHYFFVTVQCVKVLSFHNYKQLFFPFLIWSGSLVLSVIFKRFDLDECNLRHWIKNLI